MTEITLEIHKFTLQTKTLFFLPTKNYKKQIVIPVHSGSFFLYVFTVGRVFFAFFPFPLRPQTLQMSLLQMSLLRQTVLVRFNLTKPPSSL